MKLPVNRALTNHDIMRHIERIKIPFFRGVYMRDNLPKRPWKIECLILNHDSVQSTGTHWTALAKLNNTAWYFDSYGRLLPPLEVKKYLGEKTTVLYNYNQYQKFNTFICGQLCIEFLFNFWKRNVKNI